MHRDGAKRKGMYPHEHGMYAWTCRRSRGLNSIRRPSPQSPGRAGQTSESPDVMLCKLFGSRRLV